jgi:hypothetical protein
MIGSEELESAEHLIGDGLGKLHIEAKSDEASTLNYIMCLRNISEDYTRINLMEA